MEKADTLKSECDTYVEAETVFEDSEISSLSNITDAVSEVNPFLEGINKVKDLTQELEESFRESNNIGNNLIWRCVLLRAENQNLVQKIYENKRTLTSESLFCPLRNKDKSLEKIPTNNETKRIACRISKSGTNFHHSHRDNREEIEILHRTIEDLQRKLKERDKKIQTICEKYLYLKTNKSKMESELRSKILSLEDQLDMTYKTLNKVQNEAEENIEKSLSETNNTYEALFLQEKLRCSKLMYEKVRLHHEIKRLEDNLRRQAMTSKGTNGHWKDVKSSLDKSTSEPLMRHF